MYNTTTKTKSVNITFSGKVTHHCSFDNCTYMQPLGDEQMGGLRTGGGAGDGQQSVGRALHKLVSAKSE